VRAAFEKPRSRPVLFSFPNEAGAHKVLSVLKASATKTIRIGVDKSADRMAAIRKPLAQLSADLRLFGKHVTNEMQDLRRNVEIRPVTGATLFRHCLEDLRKRVGAMTESVERLEMVTTDGTSIDCLLELFLNLYYANEEAISAIEGRLQSYGYDPSSFLPEQDLNLNSDCDLDLDLDLDLGNGPFPEISSPVNFVGRSTKGISAQSLTLGRNPNKPAVRNVGEEVRDMPFSDERHLTKVTSVVEALAPMTVAKSKIQNLNGDTPSSISVSSPGALTPSMRQLLGKYATDGQSSQSEVRVSGGTNMSISPLPMLSPAFAMAAASQTAQLNRALVNDYEHKTDPDLSLPLSLPGGDEEENTMELKSQVIRSRGIAGAGPVQSKPLLTATPSLSRTSDGVKPLRQSLTSSLTPSLPTVVAPLRPVNEAAYSSLPNFIQGQLSLETMNSAAVSVHAAASRRCEAGGGAYFTVDDIEAASPLPSAKGKVFLSAMTKLGHVQLKVVYGQGTVYFFV
jgi:hypothetical protein